MEQSLAYLRETVSNYTEEQVLANQIFEKLNKMDAKNEKSFVNSLDQEEIEFLNKVLPDEINYAMEERDFERVQQLNEVYELLY